jgi:hypothetical protein
MVYKVKPVHLQVKFFCSGPEISPEMAGEKPVSNQISPVITSNHAEKKCKLLLQPF